MLRGWNSCTGCSNGAGLRVGSLRIMFAGCVKASHLLGEPPAASSPAGPWPLRCSCSRRHNNGESTQKHSWSLDCSGGIRELGIAEFRYSYMLPEHNGPTTAPLLRFHSAKTGDQNYLKAFRMTQQTQKTQFCSDTGVLSVPRFSQSESLPIHSAPLLE